jgi:hypothetical protein
MTPDIRPQSELIKPIPFSEQIQKLSDIDNPTPLRPENINPEQINNELRQRRICADIINFDSKLQKSIREKKFRDASHGRRPAVVAVIGKGGYDEFFKWAQIDSKNQPRLKSKKKDNKKETPADREKREKTRCRGEAQLMADILALASGNMTKEVFCRRTNWRVGISHKNNPELSKKFGISSDSANQEELRYISSIPVGSPIRVYQKMLSLAPSPNESTNLHFGNQQRTNLENDRNLDGMKGSYSAAVEGDMDNMGDY